MNLNLIIGNCLTRRDGDDVTSSSCQTLFYIQILLKIEQWALLNDSISQKFYTDLLFYLENDQQHDCSKTLVGRAVFYAKEYNLGLKRYISSDKYHAVTKLEEYNMKNGQNGLVDSLRNLLNHHCPNNRYFVELLLKTF